MIKKMIVASMVTVALIFSGCGSDGDGESQLETQQMLDDKDYVGVIAKLESRASTNSDYLALAAAYMGKAGFSLASILGIVATSAESNDASTFATFIENTQSVSNSQSLQDLNSAVLYYKKVVANRCLDRGVTLSGAEENICLYVGLSKVSQTAVAVGYIAGDVNVLNDSLRSDNKLTASTCAMQYALDPNSVSNSTCTLSAESNLTFTQSNMRYGNITITVDNNQTFEYLITPSGIANNRSIALTSGLCTLTDFSTRVSQTDITNEAYHVCPLDEENRASPTTTGSILVQALNEGTDSIVAAVSDDIRNDVEQFKHDVLEANGRGSDTNTTIAVADIIKYFELKNQ